MLSRLQGLFKQGTEEAIHKAYSILGNDGTGEKYILLKMEFFPFVTVLTFYFQIRLYILKAEIKTIAQ